MMCGLPIPWGYLQVCYRLAGSLTQLVYQLTWTMNTNTRLPQKPFVGSRPYLPERSKSTVVDCISPHFN